MLAHGEKTRNSKLENFLRRKMKTEDYEDVRWYEPVVVRREGSLSYKHVVVTGEKIFLVDTPPKDVTPLFCVKDIMAVVMVHDLPEFLEGGLRDRTTHIFLKIRSEEPAKEVSESMNKLKISIPTNRRGSTTRRGSLQIPITEETYSKSLPEEEEVESSVDTKDDTGKKSLPRRFSRGFFSLSSIDLEKLNNIQKVDKPKLNKSRRKRPPFLRSLRISETNEDVLDKGGTESQRSISYTGSPLEESLDEGFTSSLYVKGDFGVNRPISPALFEIFNRVDLKVTTPTGSSALGRSLTPDFSSHQPPIPRSLSAFDSYEAELDQDPFRSRSALDKPLNLINGKGGTLQRRSRSTSFIDTAGEGGPNEEGSEELHLYTLSTSTLLFHLLHSLWMSSLLATPGSVSCRQMTPDGVGQTLKSLCQELRETEDTEQVLSLLTDLQHGMVKYSNVRRVFWKDTEALSLIRAFLRRSSNPFDDSDSTDQTYFEKRGRELKVLSLALKIIETSLSRSQGCPFKAKVFMNRSLLKSMLKELFAVPEIAPPYHLMCKRFLTDYKELTDGSWQLLPEKEVLFMVQRVIDSSVGAIFQYIEAIFETGWTSAPSGNANVRIKSASPMALSSMLQFVPVEEWLSYALPKLLLLVQAKSKSLENNFFEQEVVLIYKYLSVLLALLKQSPKALAFCISNYSEELRYYVSESELKRKFEATEHPLVPHACRTAKAISKLMIP